jgi:ABC-type nitrate/sulfonate/bicarbonate transport system permease component
MAQYETVYATIIIIGMLGFVIDAASSGCASASSPGPSRRTTSRWARHDGRRRTAEIAIGILPIALVLALWHALAARRRAAAILPPPAAVFARLLQQFGNAQYWDNVAITLFGCSPASPSRS